MRAPGAFASVISGYAATDAVAVLGLGSNTSASYASINGGTQTQLTLSNGDQLTFAGAYASGSITVENDQPACYCAGTLILTDRGEVAVEELAIGDRVITASGTAEPVRWIGRRSYAGRFLAGRKHLLPVLIRAGALGSGLPRRDLRVSPCHAMLLDGVLVPASCLVNGAAVVQQQACDRVDYIHVELAEHHAILAEGAASETFLDDGSRGLFHNAAEFDTLYPDAPDPSVFCAPRVTDGYELEAIRRRLMPRAA